MIAKKNIDHLTGPLVFFHEDFDDRELGQLTSKDGNMNGLNFLFLKVGNFCDFP